MTIERGSDKHGPMQDDALKHEVEGLVRGGHATHAEEWKEAEPVAEDQPDTSLRPDGGLNGGTPEGIDPEEVEARSELAQYLGKEVWPADKEALLAAARERQATDRVLREIERLPEGQEFANVSEAWQALGGGREQRF
jgi:Protein of unknown function (DUF2795)